MLTFYVDPTSPAGGDGSVGTPFNSWSSVTWGAGTAYKQKRGTAYIGEIRPTASGVLENEINIAAYANSDGSDDPTLAKPIIDGGAVTNFGVYLNAVAHFRVRNLNLINCFRHGININSPSLDCNIEIEDCDSDDNLKQGFNITNNPSSIASGIIYRRCTSNRNGQHGFQAIGNIGDTNIVGVRYYNCVAADNGVLSTNTATGGHGFSGWNKVWEVTSGWSGAGPIYSRDTTADDVNNIRVYRVFDLVAATPVFYTENTVTPTTPAAGEWGYSGTTLYVNPGADPATLNIRYEPKIVHLERYFCISTGTISIPDGGEGHGFAYDDTCIGVNHGCVSLRNEGLGFSNNKTQFGKQHMCVSVGNLLTGGVFLGPSESVLSTFAGKPSGWGEFFNCLVDSKSAGSGNALQAYWHTDNLNVKNTIIMNAEGGIKASNIGGGVHLADTNMFSGVTTNSIGSTLTSTNEIVDTPLFISPSEDNYHPQPTSPVVGAGNKWWGNDPRPVSLSQEPSPDIGMDMGPSQSTYHPKHPLNL